MNIDQITGNALKLSDRRLWLCKHVPSCPACDESQQIQLVDWAIKPAEWRCRKCEWEWMEEPHER